MPPSSGNISTGNNEHATIPTKKITTRLTTTRLEKQVSDPLVVNVAKQAAIFQSSRGSLTSKSDTVLAEKDESPVEDLWQALAKNQHFANEASHPRINTYIGRYENNQIYFNNVLSRIALYMPHIATQLKARDMPPELAVLPLIESAYNPFAYSSSGAAGLWQFIPPTAEYLGLQKSWWYDGRRDLIASTDAALRYLSYLHNRFSGDWLVAMAAYNGGEGKLSRAIARNRASGMATDYWALSLPPETTAYVPHFLALTKILSNPEKYGLKIPSLNADSNFDLVQLEEQVDLLKAAQLANVSTEDLYKLNPGFLRSTSPPQGPFNIVLPKGTGSSFKRRMAAAPKNSWQAAQYHIVRYGDTLSEIAESYHLALEALVSTNNLKSAVIREGQILKVPTGISSNQSSLPTFVQAKSRYLVRKGDTLSGIAQQHRVSTSALARWNKWPLSKALQPGQTIYIHHRSTTLNAGQRTVKYRVKKGDSLYRIAQSFDVAINDIVKWNALKNKSLLRPGQFLVLYPRS